MRKRCDKCAYFKQDWTPECNDSWCSANYDNDDVFDNADPDNVWCTAWKSEKKWGEVLRLKSDLFYIKTRCKRVVESLESGGDMRNIIAVLKELADME